MDRFAIQVEDVSKQFGEIQAVQSIRFDVQRGECFGLLGPNGAGKSTTIKMMTTLLPIDHGEIWIDGFSVRRSPDRVRECIGYVPQALSVDGSLTGYENLQVFAKLYGLARSERKERIADTLALLGLEDAAHRQVKTYSGGMIRKLEIGQAILHRPNVLFLDEPTVGLDPVARHGVWTHIEQLRKEFHMTILLTTHYMDEAESLCSRIAIMSRGKLAAIGTVQELRENMGNPNAKMDEVFAHFAGSFDDQSGGIRDVFRSRRTAKRLG
jgi:ABC-2 type transport system ATP-binding protein